MTAQRRTKRQLPAGLQGLRQRAADLKTPVTERQHTEKALHESETRLRRMLESVTDGITVTDLNGIITEANERKAQLHGVASRNELLGKSAFGLISPTATIRGRWRTCGEPWCGAL
jgi:PAS domain-containing protein